MNAFVFAMLIVVTAAAETREKRGLFGEAAIASPLLSPYDAPLLGLHGLHSSYLSHSAYPHSIYSSPYLGSSLLGSSLYSPYSSLYSPYYGSGYYGGYYGAGLHSPLLGSHGPLLTPLSAPLISAHSGPIIHTHTSPAVTVVKTSEEVHSDSGHSKHREQKVSTTVL